MFCLVLTPSVYLYHHSSNCLEKRTAEGNTALHYSVLYHKPESLKLLLKAKATLHTGTGNSTIFTVLHSVQSVYTFIKRLFYPVVNSAGETALDIARRLQHTHCVELVRHLISLISCNFYIQRTHTVRK